ncbi:hypothetical protein H0H92_000369, partial [Tricholoma furcatifolium]
MAKAQKNKSDNRSKLAGRKRVGDRWDYVAVDDDVSQMGAQQPIDINAPRQTRARPASTAGPIAVPEPAPAGSARPRPRKVTKSAKPVLPADPDDPFIVRRNATHQQIETFEPPLPPAPESAESGQETENENRAATPPLPPPTQLNNPVVTPSPPPPNQLSLSVSGRPLK